MTGKGTEVGVTIDVKALREKRGESNKINTETSGEVNKEGGVRAS